MKSLGSKKGLRRDSLNRVERGSLYMVEGGS